MENRNFGIILLLLTSIIFIQCQSNSGSKENSVIKNNIVATEKSENLQQEKPTEKPSTQSEENTDNNIYHIKSDNIKQTLKIESESANELQYKYIVESVQDNKKIEFKGIAILKQGDAEMDEDENGYAYLVNEYIDETDCWISIRIDAENKTKARVIIADCEKKEVKNIPLSSIGILKN